MSDCGLVGSEYNSAPIIRPILRGKDIRRYAYQWADLWLINTHNGIAGKEPRIDIEKYPAIKAHLDQYWDRLEHRTDQGDTPYNLRSCAYTEDFLKPKIIYSEIVQSPQFYLDQNEHFLAEATAFILCGEHLEYLVKLLNSKTLAFLFKKYYAGGGLGEKGYRYKKAFLENLPIPKYQESELCKAILHAENEELEHFIMALYDFNEDEKGVI